MPSRNQFSTEQEFITALRDYFAAKAMQALIPLFASEAHVSEQAYAFADAMLEARSK